MAIDPEALSSFANEYARNMTSIRGRRVQRLLNREFADAEYVLLAQVSSGSAAALGLSTDGVALCATDGRGKQASVIKWSHGSTVAVVTQFDLHKDSLPILIATSMPLGSVRTQLGLHVPGRIVPAKARSLAAKALQALA